MITVIPNGVFDDAESTCKSKASSTLIPFQFLQNDITNVIVSLNVHDTAWIGDENYSLGCKNETTTRELQ